MLKILSKPFVSRLYLLIAVFFLCQSSASFANQVGASLRSLIGPKIMLDIRYFCSGGPSRECRTPVTQLPEELAKLIQKFHIGGVILFAENIEDSAQLKKLTMQLQQSVASQSISPLFIAVDQEGGRVARMPQAVLPAFSGNMAIGATYEAHNTQFAKEVAAAQAKALAAHGININFAPVLDVNSNPKNPVINVRAFGESPEMVASLGGTMVETYQANGILSAVKHFPGHGDTDVDSHTGLPRVNHNLAQIMAQDIAPFAQVIKAKQPAFVMTAHIQYPVLDDTQVMSADGKAMTVPATLSRKILHDTLRGELGFSGLIITDALDMAGISAYFSPLDAMLQTFAAGTDIALMPFTIRTPEDIAHFTTWFSEAERALSNTVQSTDWQASLSRIAQAKNTIQAPSTKTKSTPHNALAAQLAQASVTKIAQGSDLKLQAGQSIFAFMPDELRCRGLAKALKDLYVALTCQSTLLNETNHADVQVALANADVVLLGELSPAISAVEMGGMDDVRALQSRASTRQAQADIQKMFTEILQSPDVAQKTIVVALRSPYFVNDLSKTIPAASYYALYDYRVDPITFESHSLTALINVLSGATTPIGSLPVD